MDYSAKDNALALSKSMAVARLTEGRTTKRGAFGHTKLDGNPSWLPFTGAARLNVQRLGGNPSSQRPQVGRVSL
jgi:hypothetical protein